eukprot:1158092-Pelagomonas_calceolata.AAC.9
MLVEKVSPAANQPESRTVGQPLVTLLISTLLFETLNTVLLCVGMTTFAPLVRLGLARQSEGKSGCKGSSGRGVTRSKAAQRRRKCFPAPKRMAGKLPEAAKPSSFLYGQTKLASSLVREPLLMSLSSEMLQQDGSARLKDQDAAGGRTLFWHLGTLLFSKGTCTITNATLFYSATMKIAMH